jgi:hypothetical protein
VYRRFQERKTGSLDDEGQQLHEEGVEEGEASSEHEYRGLLSLVAEEENGASEQKDLEVDQGERQLQGETKPQQSQPMSFVPMGTESARELDEDYLRFQEKKGGQIDDGVQPLNEEGVEEGEEASEQEDQQDMELDYMQSLVAEEENRGPEKRDWEVDRGEQQLQGETKPRQSQSMEFSPLRNDSANGLDEEHQRSQETKERQVDDGVQELPASKDDGFATESEQDGQRKVGLESMHFGEKEEEAEGRPSEDRDWEVDQGARHPEKEARRRLPEQVSAEPPTIDMNKGDNDHLETQEKSFGQPQSEKEEVTIESTFQNDPRGDKENDRTMALGNNEQPEASETNAWQAHKGIKHFDGRNDSETQRRKIQETNQHSQFDPFGFVP